jgi:stage II sporulation protein GA (sporulation sigma-E factor processing peptidase)
MGLNFLVDYLLLLGTNRVAGYPSGKLRAAGAAALGGLYGGMCLVPGFRFLGNTLWRMVSLGLMGSIAFGLGRGTIRRVVLFVLLSMALGGLSSGLGHGGFLPLVLSALGLCGLCTIGFRGKLGAAYLPVELHYKGKTINLTALRDTGNTLRDPLTGEHVLVTGAEVAQKLLGLSKQDLAHPVETMEAGKLAGLRLIPFRAVGRSHGMLLGVRLDAVKVAGQGTGTLVAFAPEGLGMDGEYQALAGGVL